MEINDLTNENLNENKDSDNFFEFSQELNFDVDNQSSNVSMNDNKEDQLNYNKINDSNLENESMVEFDLPKNQSSAIKVIGVGGGGSNAVNYMFEQGIKGVDFVICNTDAQALNNSMIPTQIQLGIELTEGLGAGENPIVGEKSALESINDINAILKQGTKMVFITAGMGGGTGTGAAPIIAQKAKELDILTIAIVTVPFSFEGKKRMQQAQHGIEKMKQHVDSLIVINNDRLIEIYGKLGFKTGFAKSDEVLTVAAKGISEVITVKAQVNIDLNDAKTVLKDSGTAIMGSAKSSGENRAINAIKKALDSPLLNLNTIRGAEKVLLLLMSGNDEITFDEIGEINSHIQNEAGGDVDIIMGVGEDEGLAENISVTIIATGSFGANLDPLSQSPNIIVHELNSSDENSKIDEINNQEKSEIDKEKDVNDENLNNGKDSIKSNVDEEMINLSTIEINNDLNEESFEKKDLVDNSSNHNFNLELTDDNKSQVIENQIQDSNHNENLNKYDLDTKVHVVSEINDEEEIKNKFLEKNLLEEKDEINLESDNVEQVNSTTDPYDNITSFGKKNTFNLIEEQKRIAKERSDRLDRYNYDLELKKESNHIKHIEDEPAYKRQGIELEKIDDSFSEEPISRLTINEDGKELKSNNSFLHDNVD